MEHPPGDQPQAPGTMDKLLPVYKVESCQQQRRFSSCKHLSLVSFVNSFQSACLFLSLQFSLIVQLLFINMHPSITIYFNSPIHTFLCIIPSGGFTYCTGLPSWRARAAKLLLTIKWQYRRKIISSDDFQLAWTTCLKLTKNLPGKCIIPLNNLKGARPRRVVQWDCQFWCTSH